MNDEKLSTRLELIEKMTTLVTAGFGFVAGLAWNDAIQSLFKLLFPEQGSLVAKFVYATIVTVIVVMVTTRLSRASNTIKEQLSK